MSFGRPPEPVSITGVLIHLLLLAVAGCLVLHFSWTGFTASDDAYYVLAGRHWLHHFPYVADYFGTIREFTGFPIALSMGLLGDSEFAAVLPTALYFLATVGLAYFGLSRVIGPHAAFAAALLMLTVPLFALKATIPSADMPELFFSSLSFWLFWWGSGQRPRAGLLFLSGMAAGAGALSHELALTLPFFFTCLFVAGFRLPRLYFFLLLFGFFTVIAVNALYYGIMTGDFLYRFHLMQRGEAISVDRQSTPPFQFDESGNFHIWAGIDPLIMLFTKQEFALLFYLAAPAMVWTLSQRLARAAGPAERNILSLARTFTLLAIVSLVFSALVLQDARLLPRYYILMTYSAFMVAMLAGALLWRARRLKLIVILMAAFVCGNLLAIHIDNRNPRFGERALVTFLKTTTEPVYTDPMTADKAQYYLEWAHVPKGRLRTTRPEPGALYFYNVKNAASANRLMTAEMLPDYQPQPHWTRVWTGVEKPRLIVRVLDSLHITPLLPERLYRKLAKPNPPVVVYRLDRVYVSVSLDGR